MDVDSVDAGQVPPLPSSLPIDEVTVATSSDDDGPDLRRQTSKAMAWSGTSRLLIQAAQFVGSVVLARLLAPVDFGLAAIVTTIVVFANLFSDLGLGAALIHHGREDQPFESTAFWLNTLTGFLLTGIFCAVSPLVADFFGHRALVSLVVVGSVTFSISMYAIPLAILERQLRFGVIGIIELTAAGLAVGVSIALAAVGVGAMSLVLGAVAQAAFTTLAMGYVVRWRPKHFISQSALREIWAFSGNLFGFNVLNYWSRNLDNILIGRFDSAVDLGYYSRAYALMMLPIQQVTAVVGRVLFPALARLRDDTDRLRVAYEHSLRLMIAVIAPLSLGLAAVADSFIRVAYGTRWHDAALLLEILAASGPAQLVTATLGPLFQALDMTRTQFRIGLFSTTVTVVAIVAGLPWGPKGVAIALLIKFYLLVPVTARRCWRRIGLGVTAGLSRVLAPLAAALAMAVVAVAVGFAVRGVLAPVAVLALQVVLGAASYPLVLALVDRPLLRDAVGIARQLRKAGPG